MKHFYPLHIKSDIDRITFHDSSVLRPISHEETSDFFGVRIDERNENGLAVQCTQISGKGRLASDFMTLTWSNRELIISANYIFETPNGRADAEVFNKALKLLKPGRSGAIIGFNDVTPAIEFIHPNPFFHKHPLYSLGGESSEYQRLRELYKKVKTIVDPKFDLVSDKFVSGLSGENIRLEGRFVDLMTILEILVLPKRPEAELGFRLSLRIANMFAKHWSKPAKAVYTDFRNNRDGLYHIRSQIVHSGLSKAFNDERFSRLEDYTRSMLNLYLDKAKEFTEDRLVDICLRDQKT